MTETAFEELRRYVRFGPADEAQLRAFAPRMRGHFEDVCRVFYERLAEHESVRAVLASPDQIERHQASLTTWMFLLFEGPWDEAYYALRLRIGRAHVQVSLPHQYIVSAMNVLRTRFVEIIDGECSGSEHSLSLRLAIHKILDIELAILLESYREAYVAHVQRAERAQRDELERRLALSEARYGEIVEKADALVTTIDQEGRILLFNAKCQQLTRLPSERAQGMRWLDVFVPNSERTAVRLQLEQTRAGHTAAGYEGSIPLVDGGHCRVRWRFTTLPDGTEPALCAIGIDVSNEHELSVRSRRAERMAALGTMAAGLAHEIRNPLNSAHLQLTLADRRLSRSSADIGGAKKAVDTADVELQRLANLVEDFLQFARPQPLRLATIDLAKTIEHTAQFLQPEAQDRGIELSVQPTASVLVEVDEDKIKQVLLNLVRNALEATREGDRVELSLTTSAETVELQVRDTGAGINGDLPVFEPFFTTKEHGTGLGLSIVHRIVMDHGGQVEVRSSPGDTRFTVMLPRTAKR